MTALRYLQESKNIEIIMMRLNRENAHRKKPWIVPDNFNFRAARECFLKPLVNNNKEELRNASIFRQCDEPRFKEFMICRKGFSDTRIDAGVKRLTKL